MGIGNNPWTWASLYQFQYFCCPSCIFRVDSKQDFVDHTTTIHPESLEHLLKIEDDSLQDITCHWEIKEGIKNEEMLVTDADYDIELKDTSSINDNGFEDYENNFESSLEEKNCEKTKKND